MREFTSCLVRLRGFTHFWHSPHLHFHLECHRLEISIVHTHHSYFLPWHDFLLSLRDFLLFLRDLDTISSLQTSLYGYPSSKSTPAINMGGHAFRYLHCPRIPPSVYHDIKSSAFAALQTVFTHVTVPHEVPGKPSYGDIDFLVSAPFGRADEFDLATFPYQEAVDAVKKALNTPHGRQGNLTPTCMYFAVPMPSAYSLDDDDESEDEQEYWVQIDAQVCFNPEMFSWMEFQLNHATQSSILGSIINPLGLTLDPQGLHIRVEEVESTNWAGSMVFLSRDPWTVSRVLGLSRKRVDGGFSSAEESTSNLTSIYTCVQMSYTNSLRRIRIYATLPSRLFQSQDERRRRLHRPAPSPRPLPTRMAARALPGPQTPQRRRRRGLVCLDSSYQKSG